MRLPENSRVRELCKVPLVSRFILSIEIDEGHLCKSKNNHDVLIMKCASRAAVGCLGRLEDRCGGTGFLASVASNHIT